MGQFLPTPVTTIHTQRFGNPFFRCAVAEMQGYRTHMEDTHLLHLCDQQAILAVFDGHGGSGAAEFCRSELLERLRPLLPAPTDSQLTQMMLDLDRDFLERHPDDGSGTTSVFALVDRSTPQDVKVIVAHVGDSRCLDSEGSLTQDHRPDDPEERARITQGGGFICDGRVNGRLAISRAVGDRGYKLFCGAGKPTEVIAIPSIARVDYDPEDHDNWLLLCCDGIFECLATTEVVRFVHQKLRDCDRDPVRVVEQLVDHAFQSGSQDNLTCLLVLFEDGVCHETDQVFTNQEEIYSSER